MREDSTHSAADHDYIGFQQVDGIAKPDRNEVRCFGQDFCRERITRLPSTGHGMSVDLGNVLVGRSQQCFAAFRISRNCFTRTTRNACPRGVRLEAAVLATFTTDRCGEVDGLVTTFSSQTGTPVIQLSVKYNGGSDASTERGTENVAKATACTEQGLGKTSRVGIVVDARGQLVGSLNALLEGKIAKARNVGCIEDHTRARIERTGRSYADCRNRSLRIGCDSVVDNLADTRKTLFRCAVGMHGHTGLIEDFSSWIHQACGDFGASDVHTKKKIVGHKEPVYASARDFGYWVLHVQRQNTRQIRTRNPRKQLSTALLCVCAHKLQQSRRATYNLNRHRRGGEGACMKKCAVAVLCFGLLLFLVACGGGSTQSPTIPEKPQPSISVNTNPTTIAVPQDGTAVDVQVAVTAQSTTAPITLSVTPSIPGVSIDVQQPASGTGKLTFRVTDATLAKASRYTLSLEAKNTDTQASVNLTAEIVATVKVGTSGSSQSPAFVSTSFQLATWTWNWTNDHPAAMKPLGDLEPHHINVQLLNNVAPQTGPDTWDFTKADTMVQPILAIGDQSPLLQISNAPEFMYDSTTKKLRDATYKEFADYCANLVRYYNKGGFTVNGATYRSASNTPITWWGIYNEPNINNVTADEYWKIYNTVTKAMLTVDPSIQFVALELSDWGSEPQKFLPPLLANATEPINALATHYYGGCNQKLTDQQVMDAVATFVDHVKYLRSTLDANAATNGVPIWVTENNVNADYNNNGMSACNSGQTFTADARGSSAFFAGWRPYVYSQLSSAGISGLWHWSYHGDAQYGEYNDTGNRLQLSYWVDYYLSHLLGNTGAKVLPVQWSGASSVEAMAVERPDGSRVVMLANRDVADATTNNGTGVPKTVTLDISALGNITSASLVTIDARTDTTAGPAEQTLAPSANLTLSFPGYGVQFITLK